MSDGANPFKAVLWASLTHNKWHGEIGGSPVKDSN